MFDRGLASTNLFFVRPITYYCQVFFIKSSLFNPIDVCNEFFELGNGNGEVASCATNKKANRFSSSISECIDWFGGELVNASFGRRVYWSIYKPSREKKDVFSALVLTKVAQTIVTFSFGLLGILYFKSQLLSWFQMPKQSVLVLFIVFVILLFFLRKRIIKFILSNAYFESFRQMDLSKTSRLVLFSCLRYFTFFGQFYIMTLFVAVEVNLLSLFFALATLFFVRMATLSINIVVDLGVRFATALFVFSMVNVIPNTNDILVIFSLVWLFNVILPSLIGGVLILKKR